MNYETERNIDPFFEDAINQVYLQKEKQVYLMDGPIATGKALPDSEVVLTPKGFVPMGSLKVGDYAIGSDGKPTKITGVFPQGVVDIARITFDDGSTVRCSYDHLWTIKRYDSKKWNVLTTQQLIDGGVYVEKGRKTKAGAPQRQYRYSIPTGAENQFDNGAELPLHPYVMGALLGDGGFTNKCITFTNGSLDIVNKVSSLLPESVRFMYHYQQNAWHCRIIGRRKCHNVVNDIMRDLSLWGVGSSEKFVPAIYLSANACNRRALLQGLLDTDGSLGVKGSYEYSTVSGQLMSDVRFLAQSLGIDIGKTTSRIPKYVYKGEQRFGKESYRVHTLRRRTPTKRIISIEPDTAEAATCIRVAAEDSLFVTNGFNLTHNSNNFTFRGPYETAKHVRPIKRGNRKVRESCWAAIRESENSTVATIMEIINDSVFPPEVVYGANSPVQIKGSHPTHIIINHDLADGTEVIMDIECHGFNNEQAEGRLRSRSFVGAIIPEVQTIPWEILEVARQRTGRWRPGSVRIEKTIDGKKHVLSGVQNLKMVFADANIPKRPHKMYEKLYDPATLDGTPYCVLTPPPPIIPIKTQTLQDRTLLEKYPVTRFEKNEVVWVPNPKAYFMTKHFETDVLDEITGETITDANGVPQTVPWSGYTYWFNELQQDDGILRRHILGKPANVGGAASVYQNFDKKVSVMSRPFQSSAEVFIGYDPGKYASFVFIQVYGDTLHIFHEITFDHEDGLSTRSQLEDFVNPYVKNTLKHNKISVTPDPAAKFGTASGEAPVSILQELSLPFVPCIVSNQDTDTRLDSLRYFIDAGLITVDPSCDRVIQGLVGGYQYKTTKSGLISDTIDKNVVGHTIEALQYPAVNLYRNLIHAEKRKKVKSKCGLVKVQSKR